MDRQSHGAKRACGGMTWWTVICDFRRSLYYSDSFEAVSRVDEKAVETVQAYNYVGDELWINAMWPLMLVQHQMRRSDIVTL